MPVICSSITFQEIGTLRIQFSSCLRRQELYISVGNYKFWAWKVTTVEVAVLDVLLCFPVPAVKRKLVK
jgi:hypothetical protein